MKNISAVSCLHIFFLSVIGMMIAGCQPKVPAVVENLPAPVSAASSTPTQSAPSATPLTPALPTATSIPSPSPTSTAGAAGGMILVKTFKESGYISHLLFYQTPGGEPVPLAEVLNGVMVASVSPNGDAVLGTGGDLLEHYLKGDYSLSPNIAVFLVRLDSGLITNLSDSEYWSLTPDWSPDSAQVVYADTRGLNGNIVRVNADGTQPVKLTRNGVSFRPRWSPQGDQIAYLQRYSNEQAHVYVMGVDGGNVRQLTDGPVDDGFMGTMAWSPDGRFLAFLRAEYDPIASHYPTRVTLQVIDMDSGEMAVIDPGAAMLPAWSADGRLAFVRGEFRSPSSSAVMVLENDLYTEFPLQDGAVRTRQLVYYPEQQIDQLQWSPDGTLIQYSLHDPLDDFHNDTVIILDAVSGELVKQMDDYDFMYWLPAPSPAAAAMPDCPAGPSQFEAGQQVVLSPERASSPLRALPGTRPLMLSEIGQGVQMTLLERACAPNRIYWQVRLPYGQVGWTAEGDGQQAWLELYTDQPLATRPPGECRNESDFVADVTIPDNTSVKAEQRFTKTWRIRNSGTCTWDETYTWRMIAGEGMGAPSSVPLDKQVQPGEMVEISVEFTAPSKAGKYQNRWQLYSPAGDPFGTKPYLVIVVP
jgi:hypothetical protein